MLTIVLLLMQTKEQQRQKQTENAKNKQTNKWKAGKAWEQD